jgi:hypothetical protein
LSGVTAATLVLSFGAAVTAGLSAWFVRAQFLLQSEVRRRDFEATVVAELVGVRAVEERRRREYEVRVTNAGPAVARDVDVSIAVWSDSPLG